MKIFFCLLAFLSLILNSGCVIREGHGEDRDHHWHGYDHEEHWEHHD